MLLSSTDQLTAVSSNAQAGGISTSSSSAGSLCPNAAQVAAVLYNLRGAGVNVAPVATEGSPGDSTPPISPSLENASNRFGARCPSLNLPPLRTDGTSGHHISNSYMPVGLTDMLISSEDAVTPTANTAPAPTLADLTAAVTGQVIGNPTTDGFLQLFHNSSEPVSAE